MVPAASGGPVIVLQQQQQQRRRGSRAIEVTLYLAAIFLTLFQFIAYIQAFDDLNSSRPQIGAARAAATFSIFLGVCAAGLVLWVSYVRRAHPVPAALGGVFGLAVGGFLAGTLKESFGFLGSVGYLFTEFIILGILLIPFIVFLVLIFGRHERVGWGLGMGLLFFHALAYLTIASYILNNTTSLAAAAEQANRSPDWGFLGTLAILLSSAAARRRVRAA